MTDLTRFRTLMRFPIASTFHTQALSTLKPFLPENLMLARPLCSILFSLGTLSVATACSAVTPRPPLVDLHVIDRTTGATLPVYRYQGHAWIAGVPGHKYSVSITNRTGARVLTVLSVDGVNAVSGETALAEQLASQTGYVLSPNEKAEIAGWRKNQAEIASFNFTALDDAYASRTGRPEQVGVIGVAVFRERVPVPLAISPSPPASPAARMSEAPADRASNSMASEAAGATAKMRERTEASRLGTGHGERESSWIAYTSFERLNDQPDEIVAIHYDRRETLVAMGIIPSMPVRPLPTPFPSGVAPVAGFVADPPMR
jgi:hypothetical protein